MSTNPRSNKIYTRTGDQGKTSLIGGSRVSKSDPRIETYGTIDELNSIVGMLIYDLRADYRHLNDIDSTYDVGAGKPVAAPRLSSPDEAALLVKELHEIQCDLFNAGSQLACEGEKFRSQMPNVSLERITELEMRMDEYSLSVKPLKNFILPGGSRSAAVAHLARTVCRRAERLCVLQRVRSNESDQRTQPPRTDTFERTVTTERTDETTESDASLSGEKLVTQYLNRLSDYFFVLARFLNSRMQVEEPIWREKPSK